MIAKVVSGNVFLKKSVILIISALIVIFLFPGCDFIGDNSKTEKEEEKKIFGFLNGYNHRIKEAQSYLFNAGFYSGSVDGSMDRNTREAIKDFQKANDLKVTGIIDSKTWTKLLDYKTKVISVDAIKETQKVLKACGFDSGPIDGKMGPKTKRAIIEFQTAKGLTPNGEINSETLAELKRHASAKR